MGEASDKHLVPAVPTRKRYQLTYSRYFLSDLHVHTPADQQHRYGNVGGRDPNPEFARTLIESYRDCGVGVIAVTDHNRIDWYPVMREAGEEFGVFVFPGLEFSVNGCHLLAIWDRSEEGFVLAERFLAALWGPREERFQGNGDPRPVTRGQVLETAEQAIQHRALVLAPHSTERRIGLFTTGVCSNSGEIATSGRLAGFDVYGNVGADVLTNPRSEFGDVRPSWFISGDNRSFETLGDRSVYLKLNALPTLEGIRQAFLMPQSRIRFPQHLESDWRHVHHVSFIDSPVPNWPRLTSVRIEGGFHDGLSVDFAPGLTAIIGGKGTGKSTLIEILRYVTASDVPLNTEAVANRRHNFQANAEAHVQFIDEHGDTYQIIGSGGDSPPRLLRNDRETDVSVSRRLRLRIFGQRELQALADNPGLLRQFVASQVGTPWDAMEVTERSLIETLRTEGIELGVLEADISRMSEDEAELADMKDKLSIAEEKGAANLLKTAEEVGQANRQLREVFSWPTRIGERLAELQRESAPPTLPDPPNEPAGLREAVDELAGSIESFVAGVRTGVSKAQERVGEIANAWDLQFDHERSALQVQLAEAGIEDPGELGQLQEQIGYLEDSLGTLPEKRERHAEATRIRAANLSELAALRRRKSRLIEEAARQLTQLVGSKVRVVTEPLADRSLLLGLLEDAVRGQQVRREQLERLAACSPGVIAAAIQAGPNEVEALGCSSATAAKLSALSPATVRTCEEVDTPDKVSVQIDLGTEGAEAWTNVEDVSPGQRATALLALALVGGTEPLIIDQPEDDLDNRYIYDEVVKVLQKVCESRQVVVATHNANIPVLGDAECVLALDAAANRSRVIALGGLEEPLVAETAKRILEGGDEAFRARQERYRTLS